MSHPIPVVRGRAGREDPGPWEGWIECVLDENRHPRGHGRLHRLGMDHFRPEVRQLHRLVEGYLHRRQRMAILGFSGNRPCRTGRHHSSVPQERRGSRIWVSSRIAAYFVCKRLTAWRG